MVSQFTHGIFRSIKNSGLFRSSSKDYVGSIPAAGNILYVL
jgi:hypothetical protein